MARIVVAMSGGVDSSVVAALLREQGHDVEGASLRLWDSSRRDDRVCSDAREARIVAERLGIPHTTIDERERFEAEVLRDFVRDTALGKTPNPCMACNSRFKLGRLLDWARERGADGVASGHYARRDDRNGRVRLCRARDPERDQSYFLFELSPQQLASTWFPLEACTKAEVRTLARRFGLLETAERRDSQDLCFGSPAALVAARGAGGRSGDVVDTDGHVVGRHGGIERFTIGQRRGLGIAAATPLYVQKTSAAEDRVVVAAKPPRASALTAGRWNWLADPPSRSAADGLVAQLRSRHQCVPVARLDAIGDRVRIVFASPATAATPGQAAVLYRGDELLGGGWIDTVESLDPAGP